jgi:DNA replication initiation complex subunit (GINS family)
MKKNIIRLSETDLHNIIKETISDIYAEIARKERERKEQMDNDFRARDIEKNMYKTYDIERLKDLENKNIYDMHNNKRDNYPF